MSGSHRSPDRAPAPPVRLAYPPDGTGERSQAEAKRSQRATHNNALPTRPTLHCKAVCRSVARGTPPTTQRLCSFLSYLVNASTKPAYRPRRSHANDVNPQQPPHVHKPPAHKSTKLLWDRGSARRPLHRHRGIVHAMRRAARSASSMFRSCPRTPTLRSEIGAPVVRFGAEWREPWFECWRHVRWRGAKMLRRGVRALGRGRPGRRSSHCASAATTSNSSRRSLLAALRLLKRVASTRAPDGRLSEVLPIELSRLYLPQSDPGGGQHWWLHSARSSRLAGAASVAATAANHHHR